MHLKYLYQSSGVVDEPAPDVLLPQRRAAIDAEAIEAEAVERIFDANRNVARMSSSVSSGLPTTKKPCTISMPAVLALLTAVSISSSVCSFFSRSRIFWLPLSMPNMIVRQPRLRQLRKEVLRHRVDAALAART